MRSEVASTAPPSLDREQGASAVEYGLLVAAIAAVIVAVVFAVGTATGALFNESCQSIEDGSGIDVTTGCPDDE